MARNWREAEAELGKRDSRKIGNNTYLQRRGDDIAVKYHETDIIKYRPDGSLVIDTDGWHTVTTKARINDYTPSMFALWQEKSVWYVGWGNTWDERGRKVFQDSMVLWPDGSMDGVVEDVSGKEKEVRALKRKISKYVKGFLQAIEDREVDLTGAGDCWDCSMVADNGKTLGEIRHSDHLLSHMDESYYVASLLYNAIEQYPVSDVAMWWIGGQLDGFGDVAKRQVGSSLRRWMYKGLGLAS